MRKGSQVCLYPRAMSLESAVAVAGWAVRRPGFGPPVPAGWRMRRAVGRA